MRYAPPSSLAYELFLLLQIKTPIFSYYLFRARLKSFENISKISSSVLQLFNFQFTTYFNRFQLRCRGKTDIYVTFKDAFFKFGKCHLE